MAPAPGIRRWLAAPVLAAADGDPAASPALPWAVPVATVEVEEAKGD